MKECGTQAGGAGSRRSVVAAASGTGRERAGPSRSVEAGSASLSAAEPLSAPANKKPIIGG